MASWLAFLFADGSLLSPDLSILVTVFIFIALVVVLNRLVIGPVGQVLDERERLTTGAVAEAKGMAHDYEQRLENYQRRIREARAESYKMLETRRSSALAERSNKLNEVRAEASRKIEAGRQEIEASVKQARAQLESEARAMAESIARNILKRPLGGSPS